MRWWVSSTSRTGSDDAISILSKCWLRARRAAKAALPGVGTPMTPTGGSRTAFLPCPFPKGSRFRARSFWFAKTAPCGCATQQGYFRPILRLVRSDRMDHRRRQGRRQPGAVHAELESWWPNARCSYGTVDSLHREMNDRKLTRNASIGWAHYDLSPACPPAPCWPNAVPNAIEAARQKQTLLSVIFLDLTISSMSTTRSLPVATLLIAIAQRLRAVVRQGHGPPPGGG